MGREEAVDHDAVAACRLHDDGVDDGGVDSSVKEICGQGDGGVASQSLCVKMELGVSVSSREHAISSSQGELGALKA